MKILPQLTQRQCKQFTTQDLSERLDLEITYTKSMLQVLCAKNLVRKELHYSCPQCHSQNVFVCDDFMQYTKETYPDIFYMTCEPEKEIISILTQSDKRMSIMRAINEKFGLRSEAKAMILSLPVEDLVQVH